MKLLRRIEAKWPFMVANFKYVVTYETDEGNFNVFLMRDGSVKAYKERDKTVLPASHAIWQLHKPEHFKAKNP